MLSIGKVGTNGILSFRDTNDAGDREPEPLPNINLKNPTILIFHTDIYINSINGGEIYFR